VPEEVLVTILARPVTLVLLTILLFIAILGMMLWRNSVIDDFLNHDTSKAKAEAKAIQ
jgi:uncharacterized membrane protein